MGIQIKIGERLLYDLNEWYPKKKLFAFLCEYFSAFLSSEIFKGHESQG